MGAAEVILTPALAETAAILADIPEDTLQLYPPLERCVIIAAKKIMKNKKKIHVEIPRRANREKNKKCHFKNQ